MFNGQGKPTEWVNQFQAWVELQQLPQDRAINAIKFFLTGTAKIWFDGLPETSKTNLRAILKLLEVRFMANDDDDILCQQWAKENVQEYVDRLTIKARSQEVPDKLLVKIAKKGFLSSLQPYIMQRNPKTVRTERGSNYF